MHSCQDIEIDVLFITSFEIIVNKLGINLHLSNKGNLQLGALKVMK